MMIRTGTRLRLLSRNGEQFGIALGSAYYGNVVVKLDPEYRYDRFDDGLRDIPIAQIQEMNS